MEWDFLKNFNNWFHKKLGEWEERVEKQRQREVRIAQLQRSFIATKIDKSFNELKSVGVDDERGLVGVLLAKKGILTNDFTVADVALRYCRLASDVAKTRDEGIETFMALREGGQKVPNSAVRDLNREVHQQAFYAAIEMVDLEEVVRQNHDISDAALEQIYYTLENRDALDNLPSLWQG